jgi:chloramphenicol-sensitive protein RarD
VSEARKGILAMIGACVIWGLSPLFFKALRHVPPVEILAHRTVWAFLFFCVVLRVQGRLGEMPRLLFTSLGRVAVAAVMISANWFIYIWAIQVGHGIEASLGYYLFPLVAVLLGATVFREQLDRTQWLAVALAALAVVLLSLGLKVVPVVSLMLAGTFGFYGMIKKGLDAGPVVSVTAEVAILLPIALGWFAWRYGETVRFPYSPGTAAMLFLSGTAYTAIPLMLFTYAARRARLVTIGLVQYLNPTLQFLCATLVFAEPFTLWHAVAFGLIWAALALYSGHAMAVERAVRKRSIRYPTSGTV